MADSKGPTNDRLVEAVQQTNLELVKLREKSAAADRRLETVVAHIDDLRADVRNVAPLELRVEHAEAAIAETKDHVKWVVRLILGALLLAIIGLVFKTKIG